MGRGICGGENLEQCHQEGVQETSFEVEGHSGSKVIQGQRSFRVEGHSGSKVIKGRRSFRVVCGKGARWEFTMENICGNCLHHARVRVRVEDRSFGVKGHSG